MGSTPSKEEMLYQEVQNANHDAVKSLHRDGASMEWVDKEGRTPLLLACSRCELLDMAITLLNLGANMKAYCSGTNGGYPLHYAAKRGLDKTVTLLLSWGANPLAVNDEGHTPLDMARSRGHVVVVRLLEEKLCIFSGTIRELSGPGILESLAPNLVTKKVWAVVLPPKLHLRRAEEYELAIYEPPKLNMWNGARASSAHPAGVCNVAHPRSVITLAKAQMEKPDFTLADPVLCVTDNVHKTKYKFFSGNRGDKDQLKSLYKACKRKSEGSYGGPLENGYNSSPRDDDVADCERMSQPHCISLRPTQIKWSPPPQPVLQSMSAPSSGRFTQVTSNRLIADSMSEELAYALALSESIKTATAEGILISADVSNEVCPSTYPEQKLPNISCNAWGHQKTKKQINATRTSSYNATRTSSYRAIFSASQRWASSRSLSKSLKEVLDGEVQEAAHAAPPSAPPFPHTAANPMFPESHTKSAGTCVVCWDAPAEGACIPCGHLAGCINCLAIVQSKDWGCPVCRGGIERVIKVYAV